MNRKLTSKFKLVTSIALVMLMAFSSVIPALANPNRPTNQQPSVGTGFLNQAKSVITKVLKMPIGTTTPAANFKFVFEPKGINADESAGTIATMPAIGPKNITFSSADDSRPNGEGFGMFIEGDVKSVIKESTDLTIGQNINWPGPGVYKYEVHESQLNHVSIDMSGYTSNSGVEYSTARYKIEFWVAVDDNDPLKRYYVQYVNAITIKEWLDDYYEGTPGGEKVDPTPGGSFKKPYESLELGFSQLIFTNKFWMSDGGGNDSAMEIWKTVTGYDPDPTFVDSVGFNFQITVTKPSLVPGVQTYIAYVVDKAGNIVTGSNNRNYANANATTGFIDIPSGGMITIKLWNGEKIKFVDIHVGSVIEVNELNPGSDFIPSYERTFANPGTFPGKVTDNEWGFPRSSDPPDLGEHRLPMGKNMNFVKYTNTRTNATPTGLDVDDLPYLVLIGLGLAGFLGFAVLKSRRRTQYDA